MTVERDWPFGVILLGCLVLAFVVQNNLFIHADVSYLMHVSQMLLAGGRYGFEFFETNPPMILYLSMPPLWLADISGMPLDTCFRLYVLTLAALSLSTSFYLIGKIITNRFIHYFITCIVMFVILFLPSNQFGQREHIYLILITPYVFASACALTKIKIDLRLSLLVGVAAGLGFCMKPYFLLPLILIESYFIYYYRRLFGWVRLETITILSILMIYLVTSFLFLPTYFTIIMPLVNQFYFIGITQPWSVILPSPHVIYALVITFASLFYLKHTHYPMLLIVLILASLGANLAFLATHTMWFYHTLPAVGFAAILISLITAEATSPVTFRASAPFIVTSFFILYFPLQFTWFLSFSHALKEENKSKQTLIRLLAAQPGNHSVMCFSASTIADCFPLVTLTNSAYASRYPFFWWMRGALKLGDDTHAQPAINQLISSVADDLNHYRSRWIIINKTTMRNQFGENFSFLTFFSLNQQFKQAISAYRYWQSTGDYDIYERSQEK